MSTITDSERAAIEVFYENYGGVKCNGDDDIMSLAESIDEITGEMQFHRPKG